MTIAYPLGLRTILRASKSRSQPAAFRMTAPRRGFAYVQATGTDTPVLWDIQFKFDKFDAIRFQLWFTQTLGRGLQEFTLPILTEFGLIEHIVRFTDANLLNLSESDGAWTYSAQVLARAQVIPQGYIDAAELIEALPNWNEWAYILDIAINQELPA